MNKNFAGSINLLAVVIWNHILEDNLYAHCELCKHFSEITTKFNNRNTAETDKRIYLIKLNR